mmetsp:Transcript_19599/g.24752  ORF Transcript_19599/g.24752 Transcript_19599/m.24752 type:complete len:238 (-) Transcript_19599:20-733(-)
MEDSERGLPSIVGFDLHHVLARPSFLGMFLCLFTFTTWTEKFWLLLYALNPAVWFYCLLSLWERAIPERIVQKLIVRFPGFHDLRLANLIQEISNSQLPHLDTWNLVYQLKQEGHILCITSNITTNFLSDLRQKWIEMSPHWRTEPNYCHLPADLFSLFDFCFTTDAIDDYQRKPSVKYFERWLAQIQRTHDGAAIFFVDDSKRNIRTANATGKISGIQYKSAKQLYWNLHDNELIP